jgi:hypothetical protein
MRKPKIVTDIEEKLAPKKIFFQKSFCCGDSWFIDYNHNKAVIGEPSWRIAYTSKTKNLRIVSFKHGTKQINSLRFKSSQELIGFYNKFLTT